MENRTFNIVFNDSENSNDLGLKQTFEYCFNWIKIHNGTHHSYFKDYPNGVVEIYCNETDELIYSEFIYFDLL